MVVKNAVGGVLMKSGSESWKEMGTIKEIKSPQTKNRKSNTKSE